MTEIEQRLNDVLAEGIYRRCPYCRAAAPIIGGIPGDWHLTVRRGRFVENGPVSPLTFTPHLPGCRAPSYMEL